MSAVVQALPLLHVARATMNSAFDVDARVFAAGFLALAAAIVAIWRPRRLPRWLAVSRRARRRAASALASVLVFLAVLPAVLPYDHLAPRALHAGEEREHAEAVHASHCHTSPGTCSDAPVGSGLGQFLFSEPLLALPATLALIVALALPALRGIVLRPDIRPPLASAL